MKKMTNNTKFDIVPSNKFNKQLKKITKQGKKTDKLKNIILKLANGEKLEAKYKDHALIDTQYYKNCRECHIEPNWLLIYKYKDKELILYLVETGSHSDLFDM